MYEKKVIIDEEYVIKMRRYFHQYPELSHKEYGTRDKIRDELDKMGIPYDIIAETGIVGVIKSNQPGPVIGLRADIDALPIEEKNTCDYCSKNDGIMHACGHDCHMAMLLGAAKALKAIEMELAGTVKLIFQPAEETMLGAKKMVETEILNDIEYLFGMHVWSEIESGAIGLTQGPIMAAVDSFKIMVEGKSAHGATPDKGIDSILVGAQIVSNIQSIVSREISPQETVVVTIGKIQGGTAPNIIAEHVTLEGTVRYFNKELLPVIKGKLEERAKLIAESYGARAKVEYTVCLPPVDNDEDTVEVARASAKDAGLRANKAEPVTISEDFSILAEGKKSVLGFLGIRTKDQKPLLHTNNFNIDESILKDGAAMHVQFVLNQLK